VPIVVGDLASARCGGRCPADGSVGALYSRDETRRIVSDLMHQRKESGRQNEPFEIACNARSDH